MELKELATVAELNLAYPLMSRLIGTMRQNQFIQRLFEMQKNGFRLFALVDRQEKIYAVAGVEVRVDLLAGVYAAISNLVVEQKGHETELLQLLEKWALKKQCDALVYHVRESEEAWLTNHQFIQKGSVLIKSLVLQSVK